MRSVNVYVLRDGDGYVMVDSGHPLGDETASSWDLLGRQLAAIGASPAALHTVVVTHGHPDHYGLAHQLRDRFGARVWLHAREVDYVHHRFVDRDAAPRVLSAWLRRYGVPAEEADHLSTVSPESAHLTAAAPDRLLEGGEDLAVGEHRFVVQWTPGHTPGHICLLEPRAGLYFCGDHILPTVSPNVSLHPHVEGNPLQNYLDSLRTTAASDVRLALPGHGDPMPDVAGRAAGLLRRQLDRRDDLLRLMTPAPQTPYELAAQVWATSRPTSWSQFRGYLRRNAVGTLAAHLELLAEDGLVERVDDGVIGFRRHA
jgi:glyoxylase-like metal-dependent hydrolase (beta-lactamase superfamily II)